MDSKQAKYIYIFLLFSFKYSIHYVFQIFRTILSCSLEIANDNAVFKTSLCVSDESLSIDAVTLHTFSKRKQYVPSDRSLCKPVQLCFTEQNKHNAGRLLEFLHSCSLYITSQMNFFEKKLEERI